MRQQLLECRSVVQTRRSDLLQHSPALAVERAIGKLASLRQKLRRSTHDRVADLHHRVALLGRALHSVSPLATLERGYAIVLDSDGRAMTDAATAETGDEIRARLSKGELLANVTRVIKE